MLTNRNFAAPIILIALMLCSYFGIAQPALNQTPTADLWEKWKPFVGQWSAENNGQGSGPSASYTMTPDLNNKVLIRRIRIETPDTGFKKPSVHEAMLVIPATPSKGIATASYFDDEGRVRYYNITFFNNTVILTTASTGPNDKNPIYRMTFLPVADDRVKVKIETAPPSSPKSFKLANEENWLKVK